LHLVGCLHRCTYFARSHKHQVILIYLIQNLDIFLREMKKTTKCLNQGGSL